MEFANVCGAFSRRPLLVAIVEAHICRSQASCYTRNDCCGVADCPENRVNVIGPSEAEHQAYLKRLPNRDDKCDDAYKNVDHVPKFPITLVVAFSGKK